MGDNLPNFFRGLCGSPACVLLVFLVARVVCSAYVVCVFLYFWFAWLVVFVIFSCLVILC